MIVQGAPCDLKDLHGCDNGCKREATALTKTASHGDKPVLPGPQLCPHLTSYKPSLRKTVYCF